MWADYIGAMPARIDRLLPKLLLLLAIACPVLPGLAQTGAPPAIRFTLDSLPQKNVWAGLMFGDVKVGFAHAAISGTAGGAYEIATDSTLLLRMLGFEKTIESRTLDIVRDDLTLDRFEAEFLMDGNRLSIKGRAAAGRLSITLNNAGNEIVRDLDYDGPLYPSSAVGFYALINGFEPGKSYRFTVFNPETLQIGVVDQRVEAPDPDDRFRDRAYRISTRMEGQDGTMWLDREGRFVLESAMNGALTAVAENERGARGYLSAARLNRQDVVVGLSLVKADRTLVLPGRIGRMEIELEGIRLPLPSGPGQRCLRHQLLWHCELDSSLRGRLDDDPANYLRPSLTVPVADASIRRLASDITTGLQSEEEKMRAILRWLDGNIRKEAADGFSALDVLSSRRGECQGHAYLYAALARASGIPTRVANGLVYSEDHAGFLYHTWAESVLGGEWRAVDPTFGQPVADATHIKLIEGEDYGDIAPLVDLIGKVDARIGSYEYRR
jgi:transglutaminase-like putative cysteine protease